MKSLLLYNPIAGAGRAAEVALALEAALTRGGHRVASARTVPDPPPDWLDDELGEADVLVAIGGDGAVRIAAGPAARSGTPLYQFPFGTENLFAREFGMDRDPGRLLAAMERFDVGHVDMGVVNDRPFLLMASVGFDAEVIHDLAAHRQGGISHLSYAGPILRQMVGWRAPRLSIEVDGRTVVDGATGFAVVANSRQYARRLDPARRASMSDGLLDVVFFPARSVRHVVAWAARCATGRHLDDERLVYERGQAVAWRCDPPGHYQLDGDTPDGSAPGENAASDVRISLRPGVLPVLMPRRGAQSERPGAAPPDAPCARSSPPDGTPMSSRVGPDAD